MIRRDSSGFIIQHDPLNPTYADGGDTCSRTGIMALSGSGIDRGLLRQFIFWDNEICRHPYQDKWRDRREMSRDNLICFFAAQDVSQRNAAFHYANRWFVNKDFLDPAVKLYLYTCAGVPAPLWLQFLGNIWLWGALFWNCYVRPNEELNQFACVCIVMGRPWISRLYNRHPDLFKNISDYWCGWRDQKEIGDALIRTIAVYSL